MDNNDIGDDVFGMVGTQVRKMLSRKVDNIIAKSWIARELRLKQIWCWYSQYYYS